MRRAFKHLAVALVSLFVILGMTSSYQQSSLAQTTDAQPNIVFILTDDMRKDDLNNTYMPQTTTQLVGKGMNFKNAFVSNPLCCPSRATIMRGQYAHNTDVWFNNNVFDPDPNVRDGGWLGYNGNGYEDENVATRLKAAGYSTGFFGKYLNGYIATTVPPGWEDWFAFTMGGYFDYVAPYAPHGPATPAPRDLHTFDPETAPRLPSFNERDVTENPIGYSPCGGLPPQTLPTLIGVMRIGSKAYRRWTTWWPPWWAN